MFFLLYGYAYHGSTTTIIVEKEVPLIKIIEKREWKSLNALNNVNNEKK